MITIKLQRNPKFKDTETYIQEGVMKTLEILQKWEERGSIAAVISYKGNAIREDFDENIEYWMYQPRVIGKANKKV